LRVLEIEAIAGW